MKFLKRFVRNFVINIDLSPHKTPILEDGLFIMIKMLLI